jgi:hypothetical protein
MSALGSAPRRRESSVEEEIDVNGPEADLNRRLGGYKFLSSHPIFKHAHIAVPGYGMLAFRGVRSDHRGLVGG